MKLAEIADIQIGYQVRPNKKGALATGNSFAIIGIKDLDVHGNLDATALDTLKLDINPERYQVQPGDILMTSRGSRMVAAPVTQEMPDTIVSSYLYRIRPKSSAVDSAYLAWCLFHTPGIKFLRGGGSQGSILQHVNTEDLAEFEVPIPPLAVQHRIVELDRLRQVEQNLVNRLLMLRSKQIELFSMAMLTKHSRTKNRGKSE
jgi:restriction endonuclease S subunit